MTDTSLLELEEINTPYNIRQDTNIKLYTLTKKIRYCVLINVVISLLIFAAIIIIYIISFNLIHAGQLFVLHTEDKIDMISNGFTEIIYASNLIKNICNKPEIAPLCSNTTNY